jgi:hypothetical protein
MATFVGTTRWRVGRAALCLALALATPCAAVGDAAEHGPQAAAADSPVFAVPPPGELQELVLRDGSVLYGRIESVGDDTLVFRTLGRATLTVSRADVAALRLARGRVRGTEFIPADANATRLFFGPTGRALPKGRVYVGVYEFLLPFVQVGLTDRVSIGAGTPLFFGIDDGERPFWLTPKVQVFGGERVQVSAGVFHVLDVGDDYFGVAYGVASFGDADHALTVGAGWSYWPRDEYADAEDRTGSAVVMVGGERRVTRRMKLLTENYVFNDGAILSGGVRFIGDRLSADLGLAVPIGAEESIVFPVVNFVWLF